MKQESLAGSLAARERLPSTAADDCGITKPTAAPPATPRAPLHAEAFQQVVLAWYQAYGRKDLPWQIERTPYRVWVSEIMLQQTQVASAIPYFERFVKRFPGAEALARSPIDEVLALWAGLGFYARARNLHRAAQIIVERFEGRMPEDLAALTALPGIGRSTAGAILSLGHGRSAPILDGNVKRVFCRYFGIEGWPGQSAVDRRLWQLSAQLTPNTDAHRYNQAIMDIGATVCAPRGADCAVCPLAGSCHAHMTRRTSELPVPKPRRNIPIRQMCALLLHDEWDQLYLERRPPTGIWGGLWCLPLIEQRSDLDSWAARHRIVVTSIEDLPARRHTFSHFSLDYVPLLVRIQRPVFGIGEPGQTIWHPRGSTCRVGLPAPIRRLLSEFGYFDPSE